MVICIVNEKFVDFNNACGNDHSIRWACEELNGIFLENPDTFNNIKETEQEFLDNLDFTKSYNISPNSVGGDVIKTFSKENFRKNKWKPRRKSQSMISITISPKRTKRPTNIKNRICATPAEAAAIPPKPKTAAISETTKNIRAQVNI